jgi:hypothetical protein
MWEPQRLTTLWAFTACYRESFTIFYCLLLKIVYIQCMPMHYFLFPPHCLDLILLPSGSGNPSRTYWWSHRASKIWYPIHGGTYLGNAVSSLLSVPHNFSHSRGVIPSLAERVGAVLAAYVSVGTTSLECSVLKCGQVYSTLCCLLVGTSHSDCITMMCNLNIEYGVVVTGFYWPPLQ